MRLVIRNTCMLVEDYVKGSCPNLEKNFKVWDPITHRLEELGMYYSAKTSILYLPRGLDIGVIKHYLQLRTHDVEPPDPFEEIDEIKMKYAPRDSEQIEALRFMTGIGDYEKNLYEAQLSVNLNTGKGKTYCSIATIAYMKIKSIVITGSNTLLNQWKENIKEYTNLEDKDIFFISGSPAMNMILSGKSQKAKDAKIFLCTHGTIRSYCETKGWSYLREIFNILGIGIKFIDEAHTNFANMLMLDFYTNCFKTYYVTATPARSSWQENKIFQLSIKNIPGIDLFNENKDPHTEYIAIKYNSHPTPYDISKCKNAYGLDRMKYVDYLTTNPYFYMIMRVVMDMYLKCKGRGLFYIGTNEGILRVYRWISENYPQLLGQIGIYTSLLDKDQKLLEKNKKLLLSTTKSAGLGEHIEGLKMTVVIAEPFKSEVLARQTLGRTRDDNTFYLELVDLGFKQTRNFYYSKLAVFNKYAKSVSDINIDQYELNKRCEILEEEQKEKIAKSPFIFCDTRFFDFTQQEMDIKREEDEAIEEQPKPKGNMILDKLS